MSDRDDCIRIRIARIGDDTGLAALDAVAWSPLSAFPSVITSADGSFFTPDSPPETHLVGEIGGELAGYLRLKPASLLPENVHVLAVAGLAVAPAARRKGVGAALLAAAADHARALGATKLSLRVLSTNHPAMRLYQEQGFEREGQLRAEFLIDGRFVDDVLMAKQIQPAR